MCVCSTVAINWKKKYKQKGYQPCVYSAVPSKGSTQTTTCRRNRFHCLLWYGETDRKKKRNQSHLNNPFGSIDNKDKPKEILNKLINQLINIQITERIYKKINTKR